MDFGMLAHVLVSDWSFEPPIILGIAIAAFLYWRGVRYSKRRGLARHLRPWRAVLFACGLATIFIALESPIDYWGGYYFWTHMLQHELLILVAAPLLLFGAPAWPMWRAIPLGWRRYALRWLLRQRWCRPVAHFLDKRLFAPLTTWILFTGAFTLWHLPAAYDLALQNQQIHDLEHLSFLVTALLFWAQVIPSRPLRPRLSYAAQAMFLFLAAVAGGLLNLVFMFSPNPVYPYYVALAQAGRPAPLGVLSVLTDQRAGGGVMDTATGMIFLIAIMVVLGLWLAADEKAADAEEAARGVVAQQIASATIETAAAESETGVTARSA